MESLIHFSFSLLFKMFISCPLFSTSVILDRKLCNAPKALTHSDSKLLLPWYAWWHCCVDRFPDLPSLPGGSGEKFYFWGLTIVDSVNFVVGRDVGCCKIWTIRR
jgi:hypothetical protein